MVPPRTVMRRVSALTWAASVISLVACQESASTGEACAEGREGCPCGADLACGPGLACEAGVCVAVAVDGADGGTRDPDGASSVDGAGEDAPPQACEEAPAGAGCACLVHRDCASGYCLPARDGGSACADTCKPSCAEDLTCTYVTLPYVAPAYLCVDRALELCRPCTSDASCQDAAIPGQSGARCVVHGEAEGSFCGVSCRTDAECPESYACREARSVETGDLSLQCVLADPQATCGCSGRAIEASAWTVCALGACAGTRVCHADGLSACIDPDGAPCGPAETVTVSYDSEGGSACAPREVTVGGPYGPHCLPTRTDHVFDGWFEGDDGSGAEVKAETRVVRAEAHTLHARWRPLSGFVTIPAGTFSMGSPTTERGRFSDEALTSVTFPRPLLLESAEVTQGQWKALSGGVNPSSMWRCGDSCPVERVSWWSALAYLNARSVADGLTPCFTLPASGCTGTWQDGTLLCGDEMPTVDGGDVYACEGYRLPTEAEWEYSARAGTTTATYGGDLTLPHGCVTLSGAGVFPPGIALEELAWYRCNNSPSGTKPVRGRAANAWGVHDMLGSVWEWTWDSYIEGANRTGGVNPQHTATSRHRVVRGGYWDSLPPEELRAADRGANATNMRSEALGFRAARSVR